MELSERWIRAFEDEGFDTVYEWSDPAGTVYESHSHAGAVSVFITDGSCTLTMGDEKRGVGAGERVDIPAGIEHSITVGDRGWNIVIAEKDSGNS